MRRQVLLFIFFGCMIFAKVSIAETLGTFIEKASRELISEIRHGRETFDENPSALYGKVDVALSNIVDYPLITRGVMGEYYKDATLAQRAEFQSTFRASIIKMLTKTLIVIESESIRVLPLKNEPGTHASVNMEVSSKDGNNYKLVYSMAKVGSVWKVRNIIADGINLGLVYRNQFKSAMNEERNDIDAVIRNWRLQAQNN